MKSYTRDSVELHSDGMGRKSRPAINIKVNHFLSSSKIIDRFHCTESQAEKTGQFAFDSACCIFWDDIPELIKEYFPDVKFYGAGRSGGWIEFELDPTEWDGKELNRWAIMESKIKEMVKYLTSDSVLLENIDANKWYLEGSEEYNFIEKDGKNYCIVEEKEKAKKLLKDNNIVGVRI